MINQFSSPIKFLSMHKYKKQPLYTRIVKRINCCVGLHNDILIHKGYAKYDDEKHNQLVHWKGEIYRCVNCGRERYVTYKIEVENKEERKEKK